MAAVAADQAFDALAHPVRREILEILAEVEECSAGELADRIRRVGRTAVSTHLRVLLAAGLITERRTGRFRYYTVDPEGARDVIRLLQSLFQDSLDAARVTGETARGKAEDRWSVPESPTA